MNKEELLEDWNGLRQEMVAVETLLWRRFGVKPPIAEPAPAPAPAPLPKAEAPENVTIEDIMGERRNPPSPMPAPPVRSTNGLHAAEEESLEYAKLSREWVKTVSGTVTIKTFRAWLQRRFPGVPIKKSSLNAPMKRLAASGDLIRESPGIGRKPAVYSVAQANMRL